MGRRKSGDFFLTPAPPLWGPSRASILGVARDEPGWVLTCYNNRMSSRFIFAAALLLAFWFSSLASGTALPATVTDARGVAVTLRHRPLRIVSLAPGTTEMLFVLGLGKQVVGDTTYCDYPPAAKTKAKIGDYHISIEKVVGLKPDLIVADMNAEHDATLRLAGLHQPVFAINPNSVNSVETTLVMLGRLTGTVAQAQHVVRQMQAKQKAAAALATHDRGHPRVLIVVGLHPLFTAGNNTFLGDVITEAGGINVAGAVNNYAAYSQEKLLATPPDFILAKPSDQAALRTDPLLSHLAAVRAGHFFYVTDDNILLRPGPRLADGVLQVARALHGGK